MYPTDLRYTKDHEWIRLEHGEAAVGITDFAQKQLGDVVFVDLPEVGRRFGQGDVFGTIESVKAVSELFTPVAGEVTAVNPDLASHPDKINSKPHDAWMIRLRPDDAADVEALLDASAYSQLIK